MVLTVALTEGPLVSFPSLILGIIGLIILILIFSKFAVKINLVDISNEKRKEHIGAIPLVGGLGLFFSLMYGAFVFGVNEFYLYVIASLVPIMLVGILDGIQDVKVLPLHRIIAQIISSWIIISTTDIYIKDLGDLFGLGPIFIGTLGIPFTIFAVVGICNAFNMLDGKDGLLGSVSTVIMSSLLLLLYFNGIIYQWAQIVILSLLVFLAFNLNVFGQDKKIFLGDHGSNGLGHIIAWSLIYLSQETQYLTPVSALWFVMLPLSDAILTFIRRTRSKNSIFIGDRLHFHHQLSDIGFSNNSILLIFTTITFITCIIGVLSNLLSYREYIIFYGYFTILVVFALLATKK